MTRNQRYYARHKDAERARSRAYVPTEEQRAAKRAREAARYRANAELRAKRIAALSAWKTANPAKVAANVRGRQARLLSATPAWANKAAIDAIYQLARDATELTGVEHEVDHIVPLKGRNVCGLHVENNLQVLTKADNRKKGNRL